MEMCKFCEGNERISEEYHEEGLLPMRTMITGLFGFGDSKNGIRYDSENNLLGFDNSEGEYAECFVKINYCPMCGRDLRKGNTDGK